MLHRRGSATFLLAILLSICLLLIAWARQPRHPRGPSAEDLRTGRNILPDLRLADSNEGAWPVTLPLLRDNGNFREPFVPNTSPYAVGKMKPAGSNYTKCLVVARLRTENADWIDRDLADMQEDGFFTTAVYVVDQDPRLESTSRGRKGTTSQKKTTTAKGKNLLSVPANKGHEVMAYLTYILDNYDAGTLADVNIFMHAHRFAWHNDELLQRDSAEMVRRLSAERVTREGYMNLRCEWDPGCPAWLRPKQDAQGPSQHQTPISGEGREKKTHHHTRDPAVAAELAGLIDRPAQATTDESVVEAVLAQNWPQLFPDLPLPEVLSQPCCAQFAVSRDRILAHPRRRYEELRAWLLATDLADYYSGRVFEYTWQVLFAGTAVHCPSMRACYCDGYGVCFGSAAAFERWFELRYKRNEMIGKLRSWERQVEEFEFLRAFPKEKYAMLGWEKGAEAPKPPDAKKIRWIEDSIDGMNAELERMVEQAKKLGDSARQRAVESGREWRDEDGL